MQQAYDFPVSLQPAFTQAGKEIPRARTIVREDTHDPIAMVSTRYKLVTHGQVAKPAESFVKKLGNPERSFYLGKNGATFVGEYTYKDKTIALKKGDLIGMRVYIQNSYNSSSAVKFRIGAIVLQCMNGMMTTKDLFEMVARHTTSSEIEFPEPELILDKFQQAGKSWDRLARYDLTSKEYEDKTVQAVQMGVIQEGVKNAPTNGHTAWDLYNQFTYHITHQSKATPIGKISRLNRVASWFEDQFAS